MKRYFKDNIKVFRFLNNEKYKVLSIKPLRKEIQQGLIIKNIITSYCVEYEKVI